MILTAPTILSAVFSAIHTKAWLLKPHQSCTTAPWPDGISLPQSLLPPPGTQRQPGPKTGAPRNRGTAKHVPSHGAPGPGPLRFALPAAALGDQGSPQALRHLEPAEPAEVQWKEATT